MDVCVYIYTHVYTAHRVRQGLQRQLTTASRKSMGLPGQEVNLWDLGFRVDGLGYRGV